MAADLLTIIRAEIDSRLREIESAVHEYEELIALRDALAATGSVPARGLLEGASSASAAPGKDRSLPARSEGAPLAPVRSQPAPSASTRSARTRLPARTAPSAGAPAIRRPARPRAGKRRAARIDAGGQAILAALDHGSHTLAELVIVTALPASELRSSLRQLLAHALIVKADRAGKAAYALAARD